MSFKVRVFHAATIHSREFSSGKITSNSFETAANTTNFVRKTLKKNIQKIIIEPKR